MKDLGIGISFRIDHFTEIQKGNVPIDWFELITEDFLSPTKKSSLVLEFLKGKYPLVLHGLSLGIGNSTPLNFEYLKQVKALSREINAPWVSDHLSWGQTPGARFHELLPLPFKKEIADFVVKRARIVQDFLEVPFALENVSSYFQSNNGDMTEWDFYSYVVENSDISMMLDVNNIYVNSNNFDFDPDDYLASLPYERILQIHLAGHLEENGWIFDTHSRPVRKEVWDLYEKVWHRANHPATLLEWDEDCPSFEEACREVLKAKEFQRTVNEATLLTF